MKEKEYILVTNLAHIGAALFILRDMLPDFDGVVTKKERDEIVSMLVEWQIKAHEKINNKVSE